MSSHTCVPGHPGILADDCERCDELAESPLGLDGTKSEELWDKMVAVEHGRTGGEHYATGNEAKAASVLYRQALWIERNIGIVPWHPLAVLREHVSIADPRSLGRAS